MVGAFAGAEGLDSRRRAAPAQLDPQRGGVVRVVELLEPFLRIRAVDEDVDAGRNAPELEALATKIKPLPADIVPSEKFIAEMRLRILQLEVTVAQRRAA